MGFAKMLIFSFTFVGFFALLFANIPNEFFTVSYSASVGVEREIIEYLSTANVTLYNEVGGANMTHPYSSYHDESPPQFSGGLPSGQYLEVYWGFYSSPFYTKVIQIRHIREVWSGLQLIGIMDLTHRNGELIGGVPFALQKGDLLDAYTTEDNGTLIYGTCDHAKFSLVMTYNQSAYSDIAEAWDDDKLGYYCSYEYDANATGLSALVILSDLLTFQNPDLGIPGVGGVILNAFIAIPLWIAIAILIILLVQSMIPFIAGLRD